MQAKEIRKRFDIHRADRHTVEANWDVIERYVVPLRGGKFFEDNQQEGSMDWNRGRYIYDSTAIMAHQTLTSSIHSSITSASERWFDLRFKQAELNEDGEARAWLEECGDVVYQTLQESNFDLEINKAYSDLAGFGNTAIVEEIPNELEWEGINFSAVPIKEIYFDPGNNGEVVNFYRRLQWEPSKIIAKFGEDNVCDKVLKAYAAGNTDRITIIFCIFERKDKKGADTTKALAPKERPYGFRYITHEGMEELGEEGGYYEMPAFFAKWMSASGSKWGFGPGNLALGDTITLNTVVQMTLAAAAKAIDPPMLVQQRNLIGDLDLKPAGETVIRDMGGIRPLDSGAKFDVSNLMIERLQDSIKRIFHNDQLTLRDSPQMTATEVQVRYELMQKVLGTVLGQIQTGLLDPIVSRTFSILTRAGRLPVMPEKVAQAQGVVDIEYTGPMSRSQRSDKATSMERFMMSLNQYGQMIPELLDLVDPDTFGRKMSEFMGVPADTLRTNEEVQKLREERAAAQQEQMKAQQDNLEADTMAKGAGAMGQLQQGQNDGG